MSVAILAKEPVAPAHLGEYLGPASVAEVADGDVRVELPDGEIVVAVPAFVVPYEPVPGDVLLVISKGTAHYAIGVLHGTGRTVLSLPGDVEVRAESGTLRFFGAKGVEIFGPEVHVHTEKLRMIAGSVTQKFGSLVQRVRELCHLHAREMHTIVDETSVTKAKSASVLTEETMTINGKQIHLG
jgi:hypothetical protein